ncbi:Receptor like protein kinase S.2 [Acorus calamus]|uniref:Receptor like protein kinase S.2 n=1 Tax=Acorus calamus TaxID=4465 RepID=A0AAV9EX73_ACOCL|nr:Receptor like protein kinase S.2 [Acorus calamus]
MIERDNSTDIMGEIKSDRRTACIPKIMEFIRLCFILPADIDEILPPPNESSEPPQPGCAHHITSRVRRTLRRFRRHRRHRQKQVFYDIPGIAEKEKIGCDGPRIFTYNELYVASNGFCESEVLGSGGFGRVYRAVLPSDGTVVAVKCVASIANEEQIKKTFLAELAAVAQLRHRNLVRLRGWCIHDHQLLLVYDYMPNRSLDRCLFKGSFSAASANSTLGWETRRRIVSGLAAALFYLHDQLETQIIHRDVKTSNVMLDSGFNARLGDFGLARWLEHDDAESPTTRRSSSAKGDLQFRVTNTSGIGGTIGYLPPESFQGRMGGGVAATAKSDVFSFGVVALEVASGRRAVDLAYPEDQIFLLDWVRTLSDEGAGLNVGDSRLPDGSYPLSEMQQLVHIGLLCTLHDPRSRPTMKWVMDALSGSLTGKFPALPSFKAHPLYITLSTANSSTTQSFASSYFVTANTNTLFLTTTESGVDDRSSGLSQSHVKSILPVIDTPQEIPYEEIMAITDGFSDERVVAEMDFGTGYRGLLRNRYHVLVKRLGMKTCPALRSRFTIELLNLGRLRHRHLVQLRGWCTEQGEMLVVYDYLPGSLLSNLLFNQKVVLRWQNRYSIVKSLASAILYLHEEWDEQVIHKNITSSAIFLDSDMNPRLGSFALAEFLTRNEPNHRQSSVRGIFGYMSPEYMESAGEATTAADIYSFGVVVLEIVTGRMAVDFRCPEVLLVNRVHRLVATGTDLMDVVDSRLDGEFNCVELLRLVRLGIACTRSEPEQRPSVRQIISILDGNDDVLKSEAWCRLERREEWEQRNACSLSLINRIQALGIY